MFCGPSCWCGAVYDDTIVLKTVAGSKKKKTEKEKLDRAQMMKQLTNSL